MSGDVIGERYRLEQQLGHGAMGDVWRANDLELERPVALKLLARDRPDDDPGEPLRVGSPP